MATPIRNLRVDDERWARYVAVAKERGFESTTAWVLDALDLIAGTDPRSQQLTIPATLPTPARPRTFNPDFKKEKK